MSRAGSRQPEGLRAIILVLGVPYSGIAPLPVFVTTPPRELLCSRLTLPAVSPATLLPDSIIAPAGLDS
jgi:hypothetical protein